MSDQELLHLAWRLHQVDRATTVGELIVFTQGTNNRERQRALRELIEEVERDAKAHLADDQLDREFQRALAPQHA